MKHLVVMAAGLGYKLLESRKRLEIAGLSFNGAESVFPAVTCVAQATLRTAANPREHGMTSNGFWSRDLMKPSFWEQSSRLVKGPRIWDGARARGEKVGMYFFQQSLGESVDSVISPAPIHRHGGGMIMRNYALPGDMDDILLKCCGKFPLHRYWGPLASPKVGRACISNFECMVKAHDVDTVFLYLPTLDYAAQRFGAESRAVDASLKEFASQIKSLVAFAESRGAEITVIGDYDIGTVSLPPAMPNLTLRKAGLMSVRNVAGMTYPDFNASAAFAMCDHEVAHVYVKDPDDIGRTVDALEASHAYERIEIRKDQTWAHPSAGAILLLAAKGSWCAYPWWTDPREAPDYATHIDIHNKPGYDPCELFFGGFFPPRTCLDQTRVKGSHGRNCAIAWASTLKGVGGGSLLGISKSIFVAI